MNQNLILLVYFSLILLISEKCFCENSKDEKLDISFRKFVEKFNRAYQNDTVEYEKRKGIFVDNFRKIKELQRGERGTANYGINKFSDWTQEEQQNLSGLNLMGDFQKRINLSKNSASPTIENFDWRDKGVISSVKNQQTCNCSWAFSTIGNIEALYAIQNQLTSSINFSTQQLIDCDEYSDGCLGGNPIYAIKNIIQLGGIELDSTYPYVGTEKSCQFNVSKSEATVVDGIEISRNEDEMASWLQNHGPIISGINNKVLLQYQNGIIDTSDCNPYYLNHAVLIVGFGVKENVPFWSVKNSWGQDWGESGYFRIRRGNGMCGINLIPMSAVLKSGHLKLTALSLFSFIFISVLITIFD